MWPFSPMPLGRRGEHLAKRRLRRAGYRILAAPFRCRLGEIDLVASAGATIVFVEVKTRRSDAHGAPWEAVDADKRRRITRTAVHFLKQRSLTDQAVRFDVIAVTWSPGWFSKPRFEHFESAYDAEGPWSI